MTNEEAIKILKAIRVYECYPKSASEETKEAIDMAIEALRHDVIFEQIKWERDTALQTLEEHSIGLGQKAEDGDAE